MVKRVLAVVCTTFCLILAGCATNPIIYDAGVPQEKLCTLKIDKALYVSRFDGEAVKWDSFLHLTFGSSVKIPSGTHDFLVDYESGNRYVSYAKNLRYRYTFEPGKTYVMVPIISNNRVSIEVKME